MEAGGSYHCYHAKLSGFEKRDIKRKETIEVLMERKGDGDGLEVLNV